MRNLITIILVILPALLAAASPQSTEELITQLATTDAVGYGYSSFFSGSQFLPRKDSAMWSTAVLGSTQPTPSSAMTAIVQQGAAAIPMLVAHLDDARPTKIKPVSGMMWTAWNDEYDYNRRITDHAPEGVNRDFGAGGDHPADHQITVGDLCFVALGQIVNRGFSATRYQPSGGMVISSPTSSKRLLAVIREHYANMTPGKHKQQLLDDFNKPDNEFRREGATMRIAYYYPDDLDALVVPQLQIPTYDVIEVENFVRKILYHTKSLRERKELFAEQLKKCGPAERDGILVQLFADLDLQIANEEHNLHPPLKEKYDARNLLVQLYGYTPQVKASDKPYVNTWSRAELARFLDALGPAAHPEINKGIYHIFLAAKDDDYLALSCIKSLAGTGHDQELIAYCKQRIGARESVADSYRQILNKLNH